MCVCGSVAQYSAPERERETWNKPENKSGNLVRLCACVRADYTPGVCALQQHC